MAAVAAVAVPVPVAAAAAAAPHPAQPESPAVARRAWERPRRWPGAAHLSTWGHRQQLHGGRLVLPCRAVELLWPRRAHCGSEPPRRRPERSRHPLRRRGAAATTRRWAEKLAASADCCRSKAGSCHRCDPLWPWRLPARERARAAAVHTVRSGLERPPCPHRRCPRCRGALRTHRTQRCAAAAMWTHTCSLALCRRQTWTPSPQHCRRREAVCCCPAAAVAQRAAVAAGLGHRTTAAAAAGA